MTTTGPKFGNALKTFVDGVQAIVRNNIETNFPSLPVPVITIEKGKRYIRIVRNERGQGRSVHCFIDTTNGDVLKAAGWKAPAKHARGNIFNPDNGLGSVGPYGGNYLR